MHDVDGVEVLHGHAREFGICDVVGRHVVCQHELLLLLQIAGDGGLVAVYETPVHAIVFAAAGTVYVKTGSKGSFAADAEDRKDRLAV